VLAKAAKVIPVMLMGRIVSRRSYPWSDYVTAVAISAGLFAFLLTNTSTEESGPVDLHNRATTTASGLIILAGYLMFDSFTSNWQSELFRTYQVTSMEMMAGVNLFSVLLTSTSLVQQGAFGLAADFASRHPLFVGHVLALSVASAVGQLFIFYTIAQFGAVTFTIIMTIRQGLAILLSCLVYSHSVSMIGIGGIFIVFAAVFARIYLSQAKRKPRVRATTSGPNTV
jgi:solute carrier family 35 (adenosine 3'-phospho 5'-phosphosulfate transporter), member B2